MGTTVSFHSKSVMGQNYIYCGFEYNLIRGYYGHNGIYSMASWKLKCLSWMVKYGLCCHWQFCLGTDVWHIPFEQIPFLLENNLLNANIC